MDAPDKILMKDNNAAKDVIRRLRDKSQNLRRWSEDLDREADVIMDLIKRKEEKIQKLEIYNRSLSTINENLSMELKERPSEVSPPHGRRLKKERSSIYQTASETEKVIDHQLRDTVKIFSNTQAAQRSHRRDSKAQSTMATPQKVVLPAKDHELVEITPLLEEGNETHTIEEFRVISYQPRFIHFSWNLLNMCLVVLLCFGLCTALTLAYVYFFNNNFIANILPLLLNDHYLAELTQYLSPYLTWKNDGLLPF